MLKPNPQWNLKVRTLGGDSVMRVEPSQMGLVPSQKRPQRAPSSLPPCENTTRGRLSMNQKAGSHQTSNMPGTWSWTSELSELWEIKICCFSATSLWYFSYSSPKWLKYSLFLTELWVGNTLQAPSSPGLHHLFCWDYHQKENHSTQLVSINRPRPGFPWPEMEPTAISEGGNTPTES